MSNEHFSNWKNIEEEMPEKEDWYLTKRTKFDAPTVTMCMPSYDGFGKNSRVTLWCNIPK